MPKTVVVIDDDQDDLEVMREALHHIDPTLLCISFIYPEEAIRLLSKELILLPDYIFIDINMPRITGDECLRQLRDIQELKQTPIIMFSTSMPDEIGSSLLKKGANSAFQKPYKVSEYHTILRSIIYQSPSAVA
jgi:CheY-like chemotaxis protein